VADVGCGQGSSTVAIARAYPRATVVGIDLDAPSIAHARARDGAPAKVAFEAGDALAEQPSAALGTVLRADALGTVLRADALRAPVHEAGYAQVEVLPVEHDFFRFYRLVP
jgi:trans-aconitate methyltransferase